MSLTLDRVLGMVDEFAEIYIDAVLRLCKQRGIDVMKVTFTVEGKFPYRFPPKMVLNQEGKKEIIHSFDLIYKDESNYVADAYASDINWYMEKVPEHEKQIVQRLNQHFLRIRK